MTYEMWSKVSRSIIGTFDSEDAALTAVREAVKAHGRPYAEELALIREDSRGRSRAIADGIALVDRALVGRHRQNRVSA